MFVAIDMWLDQLQNAVFETIEQITSNENRYASISDINKALEDRGTQLAQPELYALLGWLRSDNRIDFTWPEEGFIYTLNSSK